jgi:hypothetical protein
VGECHVLATTFYIKLSFGVYDVRETTGQVVDSIAKKFGSFFVDHVTIVVLRSITGS